MQPDKSSRGNEDATRDQAASPFGDPARAPNDEPTISTDPVVLGNTSNVGPSVATGAQEARAGRTTVIWVLPLVILACLAVMLFIHLHTHPVDDGKVRGPGDEAAPNAPPDYKYRGRRGTE